MWSLTPRGNKCVLVVTDYFTKKAESYFIPNKEASTVAEKLVGEFICSFGLPREINSDQEANFESKVMSEVCKLLEIENTREHGQLIIDGNASRQVERESRRLGLATSHVHDGVQEFRPYVFVSSRLKSSPSTRKLGTLAPYTVDSVL